MRPVLGYWNCRGICEPIRYLLHYVGVDFEDRMYQRDGEKDEWETEQSQLELPNLPYYLDDEVKLSQSVVILRYLARKHGLYLRERGEKDALILDEMEEHVREMHFATLRLLGNNVDESTEKEVMLGLEDKLSKTSQFLDSKNSLMGDRISHVDFMLFESLDLLDKFFPTLLAKHKNLQHFQERFTELPRIKDYLKTSANLPIVGIQQGFFHNFEYSNGDCCHLVARERKRTVSSSSIPPEYSPELPDS